MAAWQWILDSLAAALGLLLLYGLALVVRRRLLAREGGTFELSVRLADKPRGRGWALGIGRYRGDELQWFRIFTLSLGAKRVWPRRSLEFVGQRVPDEAESTALYVGHTVVRCRTREGEIELAMSPAALTGLQSWLEAGPPGSAAGAGG